MSDLIRRSDAIKAIIEYADTHTFNSYNKGMHKAVSIIEDIPSADRPKGEWIPCSERLPTWEHSYCLITYVTDYSTDVLIDCWDDEGKGWCDHQGCGGEVVAWMPLPEPWKGADDE